MLKHLLYILLVVLPLATLSQENPDRYISISYYGGYGVYPGISGEIEQVLGSSEKLKQKKRKTKHKRTQYVGAYQIGGFLHPNNNIYLTTSLNGGIRKTGSIHNWDKEIWVGVGIIRSIHLYPTYALDSDSGGSSTISLAGQWGFAPSIGVGLGKSFSTFSATPMNWFVRVRSIFQVPYNHTFLIHPMIEVGIRAKLSSKRVNH